MISISDKPKENGSAIVTIGPFKDENSDTVTPSSIRWSLCTPQGSIVNSREHVSVTPPDSTITLLLEGDDLAVGTYGTLKRRILVRALYNSTLGDNIPLIEQAEFEIERTPIAA